MRIAGVAAIATLILASSARADAAADANGGLAALNAGDYDRAIALFNRALDQEGLQGDDREFGLACRGRAYLRRGDYARAVADLDDARRLKPDDADAQTDLLAAIDRRAPASAVPGAPRNILPGTAGDAQAQAQSGAPRQHSGFWNELGKAIVGGAIAGIQQGLQDAAQGDQSPN